MRELMLKTKVEIRVHLLEDEFEGSPITFAEFIERLKRDRDFRQSVMLEHIQEVEEYNILNLILEQDPPIEIKVYEVKL